MKNTPFRCTRLTMLIIGSIVLTATLAAQTPFKIPITIVDTVYNAAGGTINRVRISTIAFGLHPSATDCYDYPQWFSGWATHWSLDDPDSIQENEYPGDP